MATEAKDIFDAQSQSLSQLLCQNGLGLYIPAYQRAYGWGKDKVVKLLDDTLHGLRTLQQNADNFTFLGTIITIHDTNFATVQPVVRAEVPSKVLTVIDGQQRLTTLLALTACLHSQIRLRHWKLFRGNDPTSTDEALTYLSEQTKQILAPLGLTFFEQQQYGDVRIYPRMIRAFTDQWARKKPNNVYESPLAHLIYAYAQLAETEGLTGKVTDFKAQPRANAKGGEGEADLVRRFNELRTMLNQLAGGESDEDVEGLPPISSFAGQPSYQKAVLGHELPDFVVEYLTEDPDERALELVRLLILASYVLNRIAMTVVQGRDEDYAFTIFESLNTTGEPLTAFETFAPRVVMAEGLANYAKSPAKGLMDDVRSYVEGFRSGPPRQNATRDLLVAFALAETGDKLSRRLADQRIWLKEQFERHGDNDGRTEFLTGLRDTSAFLGSTWRDSSTALPALPADGTSDTLKLCLSFLGQMNHSVALGALIRFYSRAITATSDDKRAALADLEGAAKAATAFTIFWRGTRRTTGNIDTQYRELMTGTNSKSGAAPLARSAKKGSGSVALAEFQAELKARLSDIGGISGESDWLAAARNLPLYGINQPLSRFLLLAAYHDSADDPDRAGLIVKGKVDASPCLNYDGWAGSKHLTVEHVAPQTPDALTPGWSSDLYDDRELVDRLGNLVLTPLAVNSSLGNRSWKHKSVLFRALGANTDGEARKQLSDAEVEGITFAASTEDLATASRHLPHLVSIGRLNEDWAQVFVDQRTERLLSLAWRRLLPWLDPATTGA